MTVLIISPTPLVLIKHGHLVWLTVNFHIIYHKIGPRFHSGVMSHKVGKPMKIIKFHMILAVNFTISNKKQTSLGNKQCHCTYVKSEEQIVSIMAILYW